MSKRTARKRRHLPAFPCVECGECCRRALLLVPAETLTAAGLAMDADGACTQLEGNRCGIYETRPEICRVEYVGALMVGKTFASWNDYHAATADACNEWITDAGGTQLVQLGGK